MDFDLARHGLHVADVWRNAVPARLVEEAVLRDGGMLASSGALVVSSGLRTGRSPKDKRIVRHPQSASDVAWGEVNMPLDDAGFLASRRRAAAYLNARSRLYVVDGFAGWDVDERLKVRVICERAYHALFMHNLLVRPSAEELAAFGAPDYVLYNAGRCPADPAPRAAAPAACVHISLERGEMVILGTEYAGEMKKGVFTIANYIFPKRGLLSMHCSANEGPRGDVTLFFGLSGTGKTTLSADLRRRLIGDDEHCWTRRGVFNIEGGCYAKCLGLAPQHEPQIFQALRFGSLLENVACDPLSRVVDFHDASRTENTRAAYPIEFIDGAKRPCLGGHPRNIVFLACDAFGVLPPLCRLSPDQAMFHFLCGYTAKVAGTEVGVREPQATFSACFGEAFLVWPAATYARLLAERISRHGTQAWLLNTGWTGGPAGEGTRIKLAHTRAMVDAIHAGVLDEVPLVEDRRFHLHRLTRCPGVPDELLSPDRAWPQPARYCQAAERLSARFQEHFDRYADAQLQAACGAS
jgi:phosphoenolpyruvate carboxykinase (ATP)